MKKFIALSIMALALASPGFAEDKPYQSLRVGLDVSYAMPVMDQVNVQLNKGGSNVTEMGSGIAGMVNIDVALAPFMMVGLRGGYLYCMAASANYIFEIQKTTLNAALIPVEIGLNTNFELPGTPASIMAGIYGGYGFAAASFQNDYNWLGQSATFTQPYDGSGFVGEILAAFMYKLPSGISVNVNGGYRLAKIMQLKQTQDVEYSVLGVPISAGTKGDVLKDSDNNDLAFDFSGFNIGLGVSFGF